MKRTIYLLHIIMLMIPITTSCTSDDDNLNIPGNEPTALYEVKSDIQLPINILLGNIPDEYAGIAEQVTNISHSERTLW